MLKKEKVRLISVLFVLGLTLLLSGCSSSDDVAKNIEGEGNVAVKLANTEVISKNLDNTGIDLAVLDEEGNIVDSVNVDSDQEVVNLNLPAGTYSIEAIGYNTINFKDFNLKSKVASGETENIVVKGQEDISTEIELESVIKGDEGEVTAQSPASGLTYLQVYAVYSAQYGGYEYFYNDPNLLSTNHDHGGNPLYIITLEVGYGDNRIAKMNGSPLSSVHSEKYDPNGDNIIDGWYYWWDATGYEHGKFTYENTSTNYPWNIMSDWIYIK